jgi:hypothetical protein
MFLVSFFGKTGTRTFPECLDDAGVGHASFDRTPPYESQKLSSKLGIGLATQDLEQFQEGWHCHWDSAPASVGSDESEWT